MIDVTSDHPDAHNPWTMLCQYAYQCFGARGPVCWRLQMEWMDHLGGVNFIVNDYFFMHHFCHCAMHFLKCRPRTLNRLDQKLHLTHVKKMIKPMCVGSSAVWEMLDTPWSCMHRVEKERVDLIANWHPNKRWSVCSWEKNWEIPDCSRQYFYWITSPVPSGPPSQSLILCHHKRTKWTATQPWIPTNNTCYILIVV